MNTRVDTVMSMIDGGSLDTGTGYGRPRPTSLHQLTDVGASTPMGELMRRYWHPVGLVSDATETPKALRALGEDLVLFRDRDGRPGLVVARCAHRGASLYYGKVEARGIRCCYHGWLFDVEGRCLEQPCEPDGGRQRERMRVPRAGAVRADLRRHGPAERKPALPRYDALERLDAGEFLEADDSSVGGGGPAVIPCNWLQHYENHMDTFHVPILPGSFSGVQFVEQMGLMPQVTWEYTDKGVKTVSQRRLPDGTLFHRVSEAVLPTLRVIPSPRVAGYRRVETIGWVLPIDGTSFRIYTAGRVTSAGEIGRVRSRLNGKLWEELTHEEHQRFTGDYEAQVGQGAITAHSEENLVSSDKGVAMVRLMLKRQLDAIAAGRDPAGVVRDADAPSLVFEAGNFLIDG